MRELKFSEILKRNNEFSQRAQGNKYNVRILCNITINTIKDLLDYSLYSSDILPNVSIGNYDNVVQDSAYCNDQDLVIIFYDSLKFADSLPVYFEAIDDSFYSNLLTRICNDIDLILDNLKNCSNIIFNSFSSNCFISNYTDQTLLDKLVLELNLYIESKTIRNLNILNLDKVLIKSGITASIDLRFYYSSKAPYTISFLKNYVEAIEPIIWRQNGKLKKAIIFDCDNTLWKGIIGEDGMERIQMTPSTHDGEIFYRIQQIAVYLSQRGIIIGICSKNNEQDVTPIFNNQEGKATLKSDHIVISKINWNDKATNLQEIAGELNIGLDSIVFVDDSSFETNLINTQLPKVTTIQVPSNLVEYPRTLLTNIYKYFNLKVSEEDVNKTQIYKNQINRNNSKKQNQNIKEYLASIHIKLTFFINPKNQIERLAQLTQKTNQFNLTTKRYTEHQMEKFIDDDKYLVFSLDVKDDFGDNGITALSIIEICNNEKAIFDTFLMSCRIIGRNIEYVFLNEIIKILQNNGIKQIQASYIPTPKNTQVIDLYEKVGFDIEKNENDYKNYTLSTDKFIPNNIDYIKLTF